MANQKIPPNTDREELDLDAIIEQQQLHDKLQNILDSEDKELINALDGNDKVKVTRRDHAKVTHPGLKIYS